MKSLIDVLVVEEPITRVAELAKIPIAFTVDGVLDVISGRSREGSAVLHERQLEAPYIKDYDATAGEGPSSWAARFDVTTWGLLSAYAATTRVGGAVVACNTPGFAMLEGRSDLAVLWDMRVAPDARGRGVGSALFRVAEGWARRRGCRELKIETQNVNLAACRFYERMGCDLRGIHPMAYPEFPGEIQLLWYKSLDDHGRVRASTSFAPCVR